MKLDNILQLNWCAIHRVKDIFSCSWWSADQLIFSQEYAEWTWMNYCNLINVPYIGSNNFPIYQSSTCSWFSAETADHRYQVLHINQDPILDRHSLVVVTGLKSSFFDAPLVPPDKKNIAPDRGVPPLRETWNLVYNPLPYYIFTTQNFKPGLQLFIFFGKSHMVPE